LRACDYGAPTTRKRLFLVARCDGLPIVFPEPTHGTGRNPYRTAAECIDWAIPCPSIFTRAKPLVDSTCRRIARGLTKFVLENPKPFLVAIDNQTSTGAVWDTDKPLSTSTSKARHCLVQPYIVRYHGEKSTTENRGIGLGQPLATQTTENRFGLVAAHITKFKQHSTGTACDEPLHTITAGGHSARPAATPHGMGLVTAFIAKHYGGGENGQQPKGFLPLEPVHTITAQDHHAVVTAQLGDGTEAADNRHLVAAFLTKFYGTGIGQPVSASLDTITTKDRFGLVTVILEGEEFVVTDIGMRMLTPRELFRAQGFGDNYVIDPVFKSKPLTKTLQVRMVGNSVCPDVARAIVLANYVQPAMAEAADD
jgi:DNA (cytosine-5)-methyltransferase 1